MNPSNTPQNTPVSTPSSSELRKEPATPANPPIFTTKPTSQVPNLEQNSKPAAATPSTPVKALGQAPASSVLTSAPSTGQTAVRPAASTPAAAPATPVSGSELGKAPTPTGKPAISAVSATPSVPKQAGNLVTVTKADLTPDKLTTMQTGLKAMPVTSVPSNPSAVAPAKPAATTPASTPATPSTGSAPAKAPAPVGSTPAGSAPTELPPDSPEAIQARIKAKREQAELEAKKKRRIRKFAESLDRPKMKKGEYVQKLKEMQFEKLSESEAKMVYETLQSRLTKHSLQRNMPVKTLFTKDEFEALELIATKLKIEKARVVRKLCFTGEASVEVLEVYEKLAVELNRIGNNINQIAHALNLKKATFSDTTKANLDRELKELREQIANLERRVAR